MGFVGFRTFGWFLTNDLWLYAICAVEDEDTDKGAFELLFLFSLRTMWVDESSRCNAAPGNVCDTNSVAIDFQDQY